MYQNFPYLKSPILERPKSYYMFVLDNTGAGLNFINLDYYQSVAERHPNLVMEFTYLENMDEVDTLDISGVGGGNKLNR